MSAILNSLAKIVGSLSSQLQNVIDRLFPPEKRAETSSKLQAFAVANPKLAAFLAAHIVLTGIPLVLFIAFAITIFVFSLTTALLIGLLAALLFTAFMVGIALLFLLPTVFLTTTTATFVFLWGLGGFYILKRFNDGQHPAQEGTAVGDRINYLTGGRMSRLMEEARKKQEKGASTTEKTPVANGSERKSNETTAPNSHISNGQGSAINKENNSNGEEIDLQKLIHKTTSGSMNNVNGINGLG